MHTGTLTSRRRFLFLTGSLAAGIALPAIPSAVLAAGKKEGKEKESGVNPVEDLMREHGVLRRVLLIYEEAISRISGAKELPPAVIPDSARIIRRFVEDYHEKLEEDEIFPRFEKAGKLNDLVKVLFVQHQAGRRLTDSILKLSKAEAPKAAKANEETDATVQQIYGGTPLLWKGKGKGKGSGFSKQDLSSVLQQFIQMYRPHAAREDTVLFPAFRSIVSPMEFDELGEKFEDREEELFGKEGFEKMLESVGQIEKKLGIDELSKFTPKV
jgi:hemerythrin-like domain-containing protein